MNLPRRVCAELLDTLPAEDPRAIASRRDLRRINRLMATPTLIRRPLDKILRASSAIRLVELGAGDGRALLPLARHMRRGAKVHLELLDVQPVVDEKTLASYRTLGWEVEVVRADVFDWLARPDPGPAPVIVANLFVHHFEGEHLRVLLQGVAVRARAFVCCEPRRSRVALAFSHLLFMIGCNEVTRHDAVASVHAGFRDQELCAFWPRSNDWILKEAPAGPFGHLFQAIAQRA